ncbi:flagellar biosynthetic protein FliQ [Acidithiobacillus caldus]|uniref:Flagellar biosynthesis protein FliQ n=2 Tax=Acidithiobacillus caldus TaxID=33059 RepID=A0A059ZWG4_ACICK|nr:flagellar biosynthetic protein FliQ [Acidithiobacillus caldus]AIA55763.1 Flagellar biosynthesis protein FliQ [Acidithiobacillus caldus ATCC 51756]MBU2729644.1 flagellar biosynthetic protein FliQ [Acidithiobacillus caldus]MBU2734215.1 flagellar biosynthetic protein FliQ [Acidithiobacillus caldus ATCC 51756]MBU2746061.1 flagellar biosynthetic protein FliQ [Acidithiobacillus caldus]MBU2779684.1 flagellar biosynthetic protein FliQ [Acidithiobacillus caldus]
MIHDGWMLEALTQAAKTGLLMGAPLFGVLLFSGIFIGLFQVASQLNDMSVSFVPKFLLFVLVVVLFGGSIVGWYIHFFVHWYEEIPHWIRFH